MRSGCAAAVLVLLTAAPAGCGSPAPPPFTPPAPVAPKATAPPAAPAQPAAPPAPTYEVKGRRDPFAPLDRAEGQRGGLTIATTKLTGIVRGAQGTLALVETAEGVGYILKPGDTLGDGRLLEISSDSVVFAVAPRPGSTTNRVVLKLATN